MYGAQLDEFANCMTERFPNELNHALMIATKQTTEIIAHISQTEEQPVSVQWHGRDRKDPRIKGDIRIIFSSSKWWYELKGSKTGKLNTLANRGFDIFCQQFGIGDKIKQLRSKVYTIYGSKLNHHSGPKSELKNLYKKAPKHIQEAIKSEQLPIMEEVRQLVCKALNESPEKFRMYVNDWRKVGVTFVWANKKSSGVREFDQVTSMVRAALVEDHTACRHSHDDYCPNIDVYYEDTKESLVRITIAMTNSHPSAFAYRVFPPRRKR
jgi:hypothetical protein